MGLNFKYDGHPFKVGDTAWIYVGHHQGELTKGKVVHIFNLGHGNHYVVSVPTGVDDLLEVRENNGLSMFPEDILKDKEVLTLRA